MWVVSRVVAHGEGVRNQFAAQPLKHPAALLIVLLSLLSSSSLISGQPTTGHVRLSRNQATFAQAKAHRTQEAPGRLQAQVLADELTAGIRLEEDGQHARGMTTRRLHSPSDAKHSWPGFIVPDHERRMGQAYRGDLSRLRAAFHRQHLTGKLKVVTLGGSITAGAGALDAHSWPAYLEDWIAARYNGTHDLSPRDTPGSTCVVNGAVPGTTSAYMSVCHNMHVPRDADVVIVEYSLNDEIHADGVPAFDNPQRRPFERLMRKLLNYPNRPALIILNAYAWLMRIGNTPPGLFYKGSDRDFFEFATYYRVPMLSIKACCWRLMQKGVKGFNVSVTRADKHGVRQPHDDQLKGDLFYYDIIHPDGWTGHAAMSDLVIQLFMDAEQSLRHRPFGGKEAASLESQNQLPPPMIPENWESVEDRCLIGDGLHAVVAKKEGFEWQNDLPAGKRAKWGYISTQPGSAITFKVNTVLPYAQKSGPDTLASVQIAHLRSYQGMGKAMAECSGCTCTPTEINGHHSDKVSLMTLTTIRATQHKDCMIKVTVLNETNDPAGARKVKIAGLIISDATSHPEAKPMGGFNALEFVTTGLRNNGTFELRATINGGEDIPV